MIWAALIPAIASLIGGAASQASGLAKPGPTGSIEPQDDGAGQSNFQSFTQAMGQKETPSEGDSKLVKQELQGMKETTPAASIGGAPVNAGQQLMSQLKQPGLFDAGQIGATNPIPSQAGTYGAQGSLLGTGAAQDAPMPGGLAGQAADQRAYEAAQSGQMRDAAMDAALGVGSDIYGMSQQLAKPGPTGSIQPPGQGARNPRLSALLGQLYRG